MKLGDMKSYYFAALAAVLLAGLTACGGGAPQTSTVAASAAASTSPPKISRTVPGLAGKPFSEVQPVLASAGLSAYYLGKDGKRWTKGEPDASSVVVSTVPVAGTVTDSTVIEITVNTTQDEQVAAAAKTAEDAAKWPTRYKFTCSSVDYSEMNDYHTLQEVWASPHYKAINDSCHAEIDGVSMYDEPVLNPDEQAVADVIASHGGGPAASDFGHALKLCLKVGFDYVNDVGARKRAEAHGALALCPDAPHAAILREAATTVKVGDGTMVVGQDMEPGTYRTLPGVKDCYWARTTGGGAIIANDLVGFAPAGATVTVRAGEGFESVRCGVWTKIG